MDSCDDVVYRRALRSLGWEYERMTVAVSFRDRLLGMTVRQGRAGCFWLAQRAPSVPDAGLVMVFPACTSIHTFGMRFPLDIAFIDKTGAVLALHESVPPASICSHRGAFAALEHFSAIEVNRPGCTPCACANAGVLPVGEQSAPVGLGPT